MGRKYIKSAVLCPLLFIFSICIEAFANSNADCAKNIYKVEQINGVPLITCNGRPVAQRMVYVTRGNLGAKTEANKWQNISFEFTAPFDSDFCAVHIRLRDNPTLKLWISKIEIKNLSTGKIEKALDLDCENVDPALSYWWKGISDKKRKFPFSISRVVEDGERAVLADITRKDLLDLTGFHLHFSGIKAVAGNNYKVELRVKTDKNERLDIGFRKHFEDFRLMGAAGESSVSAQVKMAKAAGVDFVNFPLVPPWTNKNGDADFLETRIFYDSIIKANPNARLIPRLILYPPKEWRDANKAEFMKFSNGKTSPIYISMSSRAYIESAKLAVKRFIEFSEKNYPDNMAGYHITNGRGQEWFYGNTWKGDDAGYDDSTLTAWRAWLKKKYRSDSALQAAWRNPSAAIDTVQVPSGKRRQAVSHLINPETEFDIADFNLFMQDAVIDALKELSETVKSVAKNRLFLCFYGYGMEFSSAPKGAGSSGHYGLERLLKLRDIDIICGPISYVDRKFGDAKSVMGAADSITLAGKIWLDEDDTSTYLTTKDNSDCPGFEADLNTREKTIKVLRRNLAQESVRNFASWFMDLGGSGWFADSKLWDEMATIVKEENLSHKNPQKYEPQMALVFDEDSMCMLGGYKLAYDTVHFLLYYGRGVLGRCGIPFAHYLASDIMSKRANTKLNIFSGVYALTGKDRKKLKKATADSVNIWMWMPGYIDLDARKFSLEAVEELTGFEVKCAPENMRIAALPTLEGLEIGLPKGFGSKNKFPVLVPKVKEGDIVLAKFASGEAAIVVRGKNIFCSVPRLFPELIRYAAKLGSVYIYTDAPAAVYANDKYISICATKDGVYPIKFPQKRKIFDIFDKVDLGVSNEISFDMKKGDVKFLRTEPVQ